MGGFREVNIKADMPTADRAVRRVTFELHQSRRMQVSVLKVIHGYGSSGKGGRIRTEVREYLARLHRKGEIKGYILGEEFSIFDAQTRQAFLDCPELRKDSDLERHNNGVTLILL